MLTVQQRPVPLGLRNLHQYVLQPRQSSHNLTGPSVSLLQQRIPSEPAWKAAQTTGLYPLLHST